MTFCQLFIRHLIGWTLVLGASTAFALKDLIGPDTLFAIHVGRGDGYVLGAWSLVAVPLAMALILSLLTSVVWILVRHLGRGLGVTPSR